MLLVGIKEGDELPVVKKAADKVAKMRIFEDEDGKTNLSLKDVHGEILSVSQFTLLANTKKGNRPSFVEAMRPPKSKNFGKISIMSLSKMASMLRLVNLAPTCKLA